MRVKRFAAGVSVAALMGAGWMTATAGGTASASITSPGAGSSTPMSTINGATNGNTVTGATAAMGNTAGGGS